MAGYSLMRPAYRAPEGRPDSQTAAIRIVVIYRGTGVLYIAPIAAASIWRLTHDYIAVKWTVLLASVVSAVCFFVAAKLSPARRHHV